MANLSTFAPWILAAVIAMVWIAILLLRRVLWRDPRPRPVAPADATPDGIGTLAAAELLRHPQAAVPALLARCVASGSAELTEVPGATGQSRFRLTRVDPDLLAEPDDRAAFARLFDGGAPEGVLLDRGDERLRNRLASLQSDAAASLRTRRLVTGPHSAVTWILRAVTILAMAGAVAALLDIMTRTAEVVPAIVAAVVLVAGALALRAARMPVRLTRRGAALRDRLVARGADTTPSAALPAEALVALGAFGHTVESARVSGPVVLPGLATADGLWSGSTYYDTIGRLGSSGASR